MQFEASMGKQTQGVMTMFDNPTEPKTNKTNTVGDSKKQQIAKNKEVVKKQKRKYKDPVYESFMARRYQQVFETMQFDIKKTLAKEKEDR